MKTIKQMADELGIDKQRVYRYIKKNDISEAHQEAGVMYYDEAVEMLITTHFSEKNRINNVHHDTNKAVSNDVIINTIIDMLQKELDTKNQQLEAKDRHISELTVALENITASLKTAQALHAGTIQKQLTDSNIDTELSQEISETESKKGTLFSSLFKRNKNRNK